MTKASSTRRNILEATADIVLEEGVLRLTLEAVARRAGISKGGLLYHFPSKEALVAGLMTQYVDDFGQQMRVRQERTSLEAYVDLTLSLSDSSRRLEAALLTATLLNPDLMSPLRERYDALQDAIVRDSSDPALATLIRLAVDGLWLTDLLGLASLQGDARRDLEKRIAELLREV